MFSPNFNILLVFHFAKGFVVICKMKNVFENLKVKLDILKQDMLLQE